MTITDEMKKRALDELYQELVADDNAYTFDGPIKVTCRRSDGTFRHAVVNNQDFYIEFFSLSKSLGEIFAFIPEDANDTFVAVEIPAKTVDECFPMFLEDLTRAVLKRCDAQSDEVKRRISDALTVPELMQILWSVEAENEEVAIEKDSDGIKSNPMFGMF